tara:strand:- start:14762 stop:15034 length:273 start_codon:yes stop_codon:yes gene_type:complete
MRNRFEKQLRIQHIKGNQSGKVARVGRREADRLVGEGSARFISQSLFKAANVGIDITRLANSRDDKTIKKQIKQITAQAKKQTKKAEATA